MKLFHLVNTFNILWLSNWSSGVELVKELWKYIASCTFTPENINAWCLGKITEKDCKNSEKDWEDSSGDAKCPSLTA